MYAGIPVICYNLAGPENSQATKASGKAETAVPVQTTPAEQPTQTQPAQTPVPTVSPAGPGETTKAQETAAPTQAPSESAVVQPVETTASAENATQEVGPAFATKAPADEIGPGV